MCNLILVIGEHYEVMDKLMSTQYGNDNWERYK
jgi:hypothetical protein